MDVPGASVSEINLVPPPPSYTEAIQSPPPISPPPVTPPPTYGEAVGVSPLQLNNSVFPYPILNIPTDATLSAATQQVVVQPSSHQAIPQHQLVGVLGDTPVEIICPHCYRQVTTNVAYKPGTAAWGMCCLLTLLGLFCGFCFIPFCMKEFQDVHHSCPACNRYIGINIR